jgi:hypothetical protein
VSNVEGLKKTTKYFSQDSQSPGRDLNPGPPKYVAGVFLYTSHIFRIRGSSVSIVSGYGLDDRAIEVRSRAEAEEFFL